MIRMILKKINKNYYYKINDNNYLFINLHKSKLTNTNRLIRQINKIYSEYISNIDLFGYLNIPTM